MRKIKLYRGEICFVDNDDFDLVSKYRWHCSRRGGGKYPYVVAHPTANGLKIYMHRLLMKPLKGMLVDHINGNGLDNRRQNLRVVDHKLNAFNHKLFITNTSKSTGVVWHKLAEKWMAQAGSRDSYKFLGYFTNKKEAIEAREKYINAMFCRP